MSSLSSQPIPPDVSSASLPGTPKTPAAKPGRKSLSVTPAVTTDVKSEESDEDVGDLVIDESAGKGMNGEIFFFLRWKILGILFLLVFPVFQRL